MGETREDHVKLWQQCFVGTRGCNKKDSVTIVVHLSRAQSPWRCEHSFGQPTSTDLTNWPNGNALWFHNAWHLHIKTACSVISMFGELLYQVVHPAFIVWGSAFLWSSKTFLPLCVCCFVLGFAMQLHSMLFTFIHLFGILVVQKYLIFEQKMWLLYVGSLYHVQQIHE